MALNAYHLEKNGVGIGSGLYSSNERQSLLQPPLLSLLAEIAFM